ncbi:hypothetical protein C8Q76DRAFT_684415 [Earliella scabrosa]|nr:hypothetical protein C8Q76DRAFT_684415 [Earliella scabrosa]
MSDTKRITVYVAIDSPFSHRLPLALREANIPYSTIWIDLLNKPEWFEKKIPYIVYGGPELHEDEAPSPDAVAFGESLVILEFLADLYPNAGLLPADPALRAKARLFAHAVETKFIPAFVGFLFMGMPPAALLAVVEGMQAMLPPEGGFVLGEWSIADAAFVSFFLRLDMLLRRGLGLYKESAGKEAYAALHSPQFARIQKWLADNMARPSMAETWDEEANARKFAQRLERIKETGVIAKGLTIPVQHK